MKKFILFSIITIVSVIVIDRGVGSLLDVLYTQTKKGQSGGKINYYLSLPQTPRLVIMGNSRAFYQVNPDSFKTSAFNLAHAGMSQIFQNGLLNVLAESDRLPETILLHVEPDEFIGQRTNKDIAHLKYYYGKNKFITTQINSLSKTERYKFLLDLYRYNGRLVSQVKNFAQTKMNGASGNGYEIINTTSQDSINTIYSLNKKSESEGEFNWEQALLLKEFIQTCKAHQIKVICFTSPVYEGAATYPVISQKLDSVLHKEEVPYLRLSYSSIDSLQNPWVWRDAQHLNYRGAQFESRELAKTVFQILKEEK